MELTQTERDDFVMVAHAITCNERNVEHLASLRAFVRIRENYERMREGKGVKWPAP